MIVLEKALSQVYPEIDSGDDSHWQACRHGTLQ